MSPKAIADPTEIERFAKELKQFNGQLNELSHRLTGQLHNLNSSWQDQEFQKFAEQFEQTMRGIQNFVRASDAFVPMLQGKAKILEEYLRRR